MFYVYIQTIYIGFIVYGGCRANQVTLYREGITSIRGLFY